MEEKRGELSSIYDGNISGIALIGLKNKSILIGYKDNEETYSVTKLFEYEAITENSIPYIKNTASGTLFSGAGDGITINNGLITGWDLSTTSGTITVDGVTMTFSGGLLVGVSEE